MTTDHELFLSHLDHSRPAVMLLAEKFLYDGFDVECPQPKRAPSHAEWEAYADNGDVLLGYDKARWRLEAKQIGYHFTNALDWPFKDFLIMARHAYDRADPRVNAIYVFNPALTHVAIVRAHTFPHWFVKKDVKDRRYQNHRNDSYACNLKWVWFEKWVRPPLKKQLTMKFD